MRRRLALPLAFVLAFAPLAHAQLTVGMGQGRWLSTDAAATTYDVDVTNPPKCMLVFTSGNDATTPTDTTTGATFNMAIGLSGAAGGGRAHSTNRFGAGFNETDNSGTASTAGHQRNDGILPGTSSTQRLDIDAEANWANTNTIQYIVDGQATNTHHFGVGTWGGADVTNCAAGTFSEGDTDVDGTDGIGFQPDGIIIVGVGNATAPPNSNGNVGIMSFGVSDCTNQWVVTTASVDGDTNIVTASYAQTGEIMALAPNTAPLALDMRASLVSCDADGVTLSYTATPSTRRFFYLAWDMGGSSTFHVDSFTTRTDTNAIVESSYGHQPALGLYVSMNKAMPSAGSMTTHGEFSIGMSDGTTAIAQAVLSEDNVGTSQTARSTLFGDIYANISTSDTLEGSCVLTSFDSDGQTVTCAPDTVAAFVGTATWGTAGGAPATNTACRTDGPAAGTLLLLGAGC